MDEENYVPHLNFAGLYNNLYDVLSQLSLVGTSKETSLTMHIDILEDLKKENVEKSYELLHLDQSDDKLKIKNRLLAQSVTSALKSTSLDEFNPLIHKLYGQRSSTNFVPLDDSCLLLNTINTFSSSCLNDVPLNDKHYLIAYNASSFQPNENHIDFRKKKKRLNTYVNGEISSEDDNTDNHLENLISKKCKTSITKESMGIKTKTFSHKREITAETPDDKSYKEESSDYIEETKVMVKDEHSSYEEEDHSSDESYVAETGRKNASKAKTTTKTRKMKKSTDIIIDTKKIGKKSYLENIRNATVNSITDKQRLNQQYEGHSDEENYVDFKKHRKKIVIESDNSDTLSDIKSIPSVTTVESDSKKTSKKMQLYKDTLTKSEIMESPLFSKFDLLVDKVIEHSEESDLPSLLMHKNLEDDVEIPIESLVPKTLHNALSLEAAKMKALQYTGMVNAEKIIKLFNIFLINIKDGLKIIPLHHNTPSEEKSKFGEEQAWERIFRSVNCCLTSLYILTSTNIPKKLYMEDIIESVIQFVKFQLVNTIYPEFDPVYKINKTKDYHIKSKRHKVHQVESKICVSLYTKITEIMNLLGQLVNLQTLTDSSVILISSLGTAPFFVENINDLQLSALKLITTIFSKYEKHRQLILEDILSSLARLPVSKRNLRSYKVSSDESIQMVSALVLQLIHCIVDFPPLDLFTSLSTNQLNTPDFDVLTLNSYENSAKTAHTFLAVFLKKCSTKSCEEDFRTLFDHFVDDLLTTVSKPEWPASELLLTILGRILVQNFSDRKVEIALRLASLEYLGKITSKLRKDSFNFTNTAKDDENDRINHPILTEIFNQIQALYDEVPEYQHLKKEPETLQLQRLLLNYLKEHSLTDPFIKFARKFIIIQWYCDILLKANKAVTTTNTSHNTESKTPVSTTNNIESNVNLIENNQSDDSMNGSYESENSGAEDATDKTYDPRQKSNEPFQPFRPKKKKKKKKEKRQNELTNDGEETSPNKDPIAEWNTLDESSIEFMDYHKRFLISFVSNAGDSNFSSQYNGLNNSFSTFSPTKDHYKNYEKFNQPSNVLSPFAPALIKEEVRSEIVVVSTLIENNAQNNVKLETNTNDYNNAAHPQYGDQIMGGSQTANTPYNTYPSPATTVSSFKDSKNFHIDQEQASFVSRYLTSKRTFCKNYDIYLIQIMKVVHESAIAIRTKAMKCLANIIESDPGMLAQTSIQQTIHLRLMDQSPSVREAAVELIGKCILARSELIPHYFNMIAERILDTGVSVRKRVIRILRDICTDFPEYLNITSICCKLARRINDEEGIKKLVIEVFLAMWFNPDFSVEIIERKLNNITETVNYFMEHGPDLIESLFVNLLCNMDDPNTSNARRAAFKIVDAIINKLMVIDESKESAQERSQKLVSCLSTLYIFTKIDPEFTVQHCDTLQPYLAQKCNVQGDYMIIHYVARIFKLTIPKMGHPSPIFLSHLEENLMKLIVTQGMLVLESCIACLADIVKTVTHNYGLVTDCFLRFFGMLYRTAVESHENEDKFLLNSSRKPLLLRSLYTVGLLCMYFNFDDSSTIKMDMKQFQEKLHAWENQYYSSSMNQSNNTNLEDQAFSKFGHKKSPFLNTTYLIPISECIFEVFFHFVTIKDEVIKQKALTGLGFFCIQYTRYLTHTKTKELYQLFLNDASSSASIKCQVLKNIFIYLQEEENNSTIANKEYEKTKKEDDFKDISEASTSLSSAVVQTYLKDILDRTLDANAQVRSGAGNVLATIVRQGLIYPVQCIPYLIAMSTDATSSIMRNKAIKLLGEIDIKYPGFVSMKALMGARKSYELQKVLLPPVSTHPKTPDKSNGNLIDDMFVRGFFQPTKDALNLSGNGSTTTVNANTLTPSSTNQVQNLMPSSPISAIGFLYTLLRNSKSQRRFFIDSLLKLFDEQSKTDLEELLYMADNLAYFPYQIQEEPLFVLHQMEIMTSVTGSNILQAFAECFGKDTRAKNHESDIFEDDDDIDKLLNMVPDQPFALHECCVASQGYFLLLYLRGFLKSLYNLSDNKVSNYSPLENNKVFDKPLANNTRRSLVTFNPQSTLDYLRRQISLGSDRNISTSTYNMQDKLNLIKQYLEFKEMMLKLDPNDDDEEDEDIKNLKANREARFLNPHHQKPRKSKQLSEDVSYVIQPVTENSPGLSNTIPKVHIKVSKPSSLSSPMVHYQNQQNAKAANNPSRNLFKTSQQHKSFTNTPEKSHHPPDFLGNQSHTTASTATNLNIFEINFGSTNNMNQTTPLSGERSSHKTLDQSSNQSSNHHPYHLTNLPFFNIPASNINMSQTHSSNLNNAKLGNKFVNNPQSHQTSTMFHNNNNINDRFEGGLPPPKLHQINSNIAINQHPMISNHYNVVNSNINNINNNHNISNNIPTNFGMPNLPNLKSHKIPAPTFNQQAIDLTHTQHTQPGTLINHMYNIENLISPHTNSVSHNYGLIQNSNQPNNIINMQQHHNIPLIIPSVQQLNQQLHIQHAANLNNNYNVVMNSSTQNPFINSGNIVHNLIPNNHRNNVPTLNITNQSGTVGGAYSYNLYENIYGLGGNPNASTSADHSKQ